MGSQGEREECLAPLVQQAELDNGQGLGTSHTWAVESSPATACGANLAAAANNEKTDWREQH